MADDRPNIILIITDQQRLDTINALGFEYVNTPNLDRLVHEGVTFRNCYVTAPSCASARASLFTGYYPHTTGILKNADTWQHSWVELLNQGGYHCVNVGKMHTFPYDSKCGFHQRYVVENKDRYLEGRYFYDEWDKALRARGLVKQQRELYRKRADYDQCLGAFTWDLPEETHSDNFVGDLAKWWLQSHPINQPLFLQVGFPGPPPPYDPTPRHLEPYLDRDLPLAKLSHDALDNQPEAFKAMRVHNTEVDHDSVVHQLNPTEEQRLRQRRHYMANVTLIDEKIGELLDALEATGYLDNSIVVFTSDHGDCLTDHGHSQKWTMYEQVVRVPLIIRAPKRFTGDRVLDGLLQSLDLAPLILDWADVPVPNTLEGISPAAALDNDEWAGREFVFAEQQRDLNFTTSDFMTMIRSRDWKLVHFLGESYGQLFDLNNDPEEANDLWNNPEHREQNDQLLHAMLEWHIASQIKTAYWHEAWR